MTTLASNALTSVANARLWLRRNNVVSIDDDDILPIIINSVSDAIIRYTGRQFFHETAQTKIFAYEASGWLNLYPYELTAITSVTLNGVALVATTGIGDGSYTPYPRNKTLQGTYLYLVMAQYFRHQTNSLQSPIANVRDVTIVGDWGMTSVPAAIEMACLEAVALSYRDPEGADQRGQGEFQVVDTTTPGYLFNDKIMSLMDPFVRPVVG